MSYLLIIITITLLNILPGPAMLYVAQQTINQHVRGGLLSVVGIELGIIFHIFASILGLTLVLNKNPILFLSDECVGTKFD